MSVKKYSNIYIFKAIFKVNWTQINDALNSNLQSIQLHAWQIQTEKRYATRSRKFNADFDFIARLQKFIQLQFIGHDFKIH